MSDLWVFGYGSLMWRPDFPYLERHHALLRGAHRGLCIYSWVYRGTPEVPGLVFGLDRGGACRGIAFRVADKDKDDVVAYLRDREQVTSVYVEVTRPITVYADAPKRVDALFYVADRKNEQYAGHLPLDEQERLVRQGYGKSGPNCDYVISTAEHLRELDVHDAKLFELARRLQQG
ncbi:gamma-glutamylcyclotransferase [Coralliovum pocilloporae]|uniref:gamma-glutamylcyclotransferase n=1 Tax=Coralliovum pocilloporae TaxID=3066369 RepID=UPI003306FFDF